MRQIIVERIVHKKARNPKFESTSLQRGVCRLSVPPAGRVSGSRSDDPLGIGSVG